jgi:hypothetical protein
VWNYDLIYTISKSKSRSVDCVISKGNQFERLGSLRNFW